MKLVHGLLYKRAHIVPLVAGLADLFEGSRSGVHVQAA